LCLCGAQGVRRYDRLELEEYTAAHALRLGGQPHALVVGESEATRAELLSKDANLDLEILNDLALLLVDPACQSDEEKLQRVRNRDH
jgi:hypothetical protein